MLYQLLYILITINENNALLFDSTPVRSFGTQNGKTIPIKIGIILPNDPHSRRMYKKGISDAVKKFNLFEKDSFEFTKKYHLQCNRNTVAYLPDVMFPLEVVNALCDVMIKEKVVAIIYVVNSEEYGESTASAQYLLHLASFTGIPVVTWNADNSGILVNKDLNEYHILQIAPPLEHQVQAMLHILERYKWHKFAIITSQIAGYKHFVELIRAEEMLELRSFGLEILNTVTVNTDNSTDMTNKFKRLQETESRIFLLYATKNEAKKIFTVANECQLTNKNYLWIGMQSVVGNEWDKIVPDEFQVGMLAVHFNTYADRLEPSNNCLIPQIHNAMNVIGHGIESFVKKYSTTISLDSESTCEEDVEFVWETGQLVYKHLKKAKFDGMKTSDDDDEANVVMEFGENGKLKQSLLHILNLNTGKDGKKWDKVGTFIGNQGLQITDMTWPGNQPSPPQGTPEKFHLKIVTLDEQPFIIPGELDPDTGLCPGNQGSPCDWGTTEEVDESGDVKNNTVWKCCTGYIVDLLNKLKQDIGFDYDLYKVKDGKWGIKKPDGWNGLIKDLVDRKADMCATSLKINSQRARDIDFSVPFLETGVAILVKIRRGALSPTAFLEPFEYRTWVFILVISIQASAVAIFFFEWVSPDSYNMTRKPPPGHKFSLFRALWLVWATLFSASVNTDVPRSYTARFMALVWAAFAVTFIAVYTGNLAAFMITRNQWHELSGIDDPKLQSAGQYFPTFTYGTVEGGNTHETLKRNYRKLHDFIANGNKKNNISYFQQNASAGIRAIKEEGLDAFIYDAVVLDYLAGKDGNCELLTVGQWFSETGYGFGFPKNSKYLNKFNDHMLVYQQKGVLERLQNFWLTGACDKKAADLKTHSVPLGLENFISAFVLLAGGIVVGLLILGLEWVYCLYLRGQLKKIDKNGWCGLLSMDLLKEYDLESMGKSLTFKDAAKKVQKIVRDSHAADDPSFREQKLEKRLKEANLMIQTLQTELKLRPGKDEQDKAHFESTLKHC